MSAAVDFSPLVSLRPEADRMLSRAKAGEPLTVDEFESYRTRFREADRQICEAFTALFGGELPGAVSDHLVEICSQLAGEWDLGELVESGEALVW